MRKKHWVEVDPNIMPKVGDRSQLGRNLRFECVIIGTVQPNEISRGNTLVRLNFC